MSLTRWDILVKADDFAAVAEHARLSRWKWEMLAAIDGTRDIGTVAARNVLDTASALSFAEEALAANLVRVVTLSYGEFHGVADSVDAIAVPQPEPDHAAVVEPEPLATAEPEPEPEPVAVVEPEPEPAPPVVAVAEPEPEPVAVLAPEPEPVAAFEPEPPPVAAVAPAPQPEPVAVAQAAPAPAPAPPSAPASLAERMAALRARALKSIEQKPAPAAYASVEPPVKIEPVEFSLSSEPKPEPARSADEIEFSV